MPRIVPTPLELLSAPDPTQAPVANGASPPVAPSATSPVYTTRRMTIFYQDQGTSPTAPVLDGGIDIAQPVLERYAQYVGERTQTNNIPVVGLPIQPAGFSNQQPQEEQKQYLDAIPGAAAIFNNTPETQFPSSTVTTDPLGVNYKNIDANGPRNKAIYEYNRFFVDLNNAQGHETIVNETLLTTRGQNPANPFVTNDISQNKNDNRITLGSYFYKNASNLSNGVNYAKSSYVSTQAATATDAPPMTIEAMKDIGLNIMFEAVQGRAGLDYAVRSTDTIAGIEARMAIPSEQRIGKRVSLGRFTPAFQIKKLTGAEKPNNANFIDNTDDIQTYGSLYNVYSQFDSLISLGQIALCIAMILAYVILLSALTALINAFNLIGDNEAQRRASSFVYLGNNEKQRLLGASVLQNSGVYPLSQVDAGDIAAQFLGVSGMFSYTRHRTEECLNAGIQEFFGFSFSGFGTTAGNQGTGVTATQQLASTSLKVLTESGRLNVVLRELLRSGITLVEDTAVDFTSLTSISGIGNLVRKIRDLKIVRFINVLLGMGDKVKFESDIRTAAGINVSNSQINQTYAVTGSNVSYIDSLPDDKRGNYISKSRLSNQNGLIWSNQRAGMLNLPLDVDGDSSAFRNAGRRQTTNPREYTNNWKDMGLNVDRPSNYESSRIAGDYTDQIYYNAAATGRIDSTIVKDVENKLEADFMPFYIHDLRTNEILSFHAFLEEASEDFNVEYSSQEGYGRMDKVQIYKGTTRNVSVNFKMVAMNPEDHDIMWYKINRLAMMIYPQWTQGRKITVENLRFIQPFSQIPGATPVIRLRLGDLYKTNYSKMAVARLFGISTLQDYNVNNTISPVPSSTNTTPDTEQRTGAEGERAQKIRTFTTIGTVNGRSRPSRNRGNRRQTSSQQTTTAIGELFVPNDEIVFSAMSFHGLPVSPQSSIPTDNNVRLIADVVTVDNNGITVRPTKIVVIPGDAPITTAPSRAISEFIGTATVNPIPITVEQLNNSGYFDRVNTAFLLETRGRNRLIEEQNQLESQRANRDISALTPERFYDENQNPVMKAFKSSGGKGLAGVITSFKIDYGEAKGSWGIDGSKYLRAPMFVTVQLQMAVIHDITPGLDAKGVMLAPIWPVGNTSNYFVNNGTSPSTETATTTISSGPGNNYFAVDKGDPLYYNRRD